MHFIPSITSPPHHPRRAASSFTASATARPAAAPRPATRRACTRSPSTRRSRCSTRAPPTRPCASGASRRANASSCVLFLANIFTCSLCSRERNSFSTLRATRPFLSVLIYLHMPAPRRLFSPVSSVNGRILSTPSTGWPCRPTARCSPPRPPSSACSTLFRAPRCAHSSAGTRRPSRSSRLRPTASASSRAPPIGTHW